ncbi:hypothetical protein TanjilG_28826 [Lupinus angustifolius]|uniref:RING-type E3 ubiquitin transferase n=1 Tax=Lupinus angustifolius TaxID=3871 RepID=A0A4P1R8R6_LUPAN|nr:PREDICTED: probable E3 ubiquitin-protein ligase RHC2A [Lupinus angustifolius]XP_019456846.1 PREDICTED: probable E3 ubiquitin-protein ligase RHC2A [Lupinus angustifolius]OIW05361.1 hypothetical protein TanjilG_28826 [Lupinus angustifolius]
MSTAEAELITYWCHECDMSVALTPSQSSSPLLCPHCLTQSLELMDSPFHQNDAASPLSIFDSPFLHSLVFTTNPNDAVSGNDVVVQDPLALLYPTTLIASKPRASETVPVIVVTESLLLNLDPNGVVLCAVCKDDIAVNDKAMILPCNHLYHSDCITPWLLNHDSCPLCRFRVVDGEEKGEEGGGGDGDRTREIRRQLTVAMARLLELMEEEEEEDLYGLRTTLNHIASRNGILHEDSGGSGVSESVIVSIGGGGDEQLP